MAVSTGERPTAKTDEQRLAELGYRQDLKRAWSGFSNFAISFTIISVLAGCFTTYGQGWNNGGPIAISWGWPIICGIILFVAWSMSELVSAYPTAGGIYWWAAELGGKGWGWFTGWFNLVGLVGVVASVDYGAATFLNALLALYGLDLGFINFADDAAVLRDTFWLFVAIVTLHALINIFSSPLVARFNDISVGWHVLGVAVIIGILVFVPASHQSADFVFTERINNSGFGDGTSGGMFWLYVLPLGFLLTMYTQTGYDASAHISEETHGASEAAAKGLWRSVFWAAVFGWFVLLAITFAVRDPAAVNEGGGTVFAVLEGALGTGWQKAVILIATIGQLFCGMAALTSASRMMYAFSRDRAVPGWRLWTRLNHHRVPAYAVLGMAGAALLVTLPALWDTTGEGIPVAFFAVVSITVIGLYIAYVMPVYLRWRKGDSWQPGPWNLGSKYKWINPIAIVWVAISVVIFSLPFTPAAVPWNDEFDWNAVNYAPVTVLVVLGAVGIWWLVSARHKFTGPVRTIQFDEAAGVVDEKPVE